CAGVPGTDRRGGKRRARARPTGPVSCTRATGAAPARTSQRARLGGQPCSAVRRPLPYGGCLVNRIFSCLVVSPGEQGSFVANVVQEVMQGSSPSLWREGSGQRVALFGRCEALVALFDQRRGRHLSLSRFLSA